MSIILSKLARQFFDALLDDIDNNNYYIFYSHPAPWPMDFSPPVVVPSMKDVEFESNFYSICGKRVDSDDIKFMVRRNTWRLGEKYDQYTHNTDLISKKFFVITDENRVYKCLYNNKNAPSDVKPSLVQNTVFQTSDGYYWKYMYSLTSGELNRFGISDYIPVVANNDVSQSTTTGIDVVEIMNPGIGYIAHHQGTVLSVANTTMIQIDNTAIREDDFYTLSAFYVSEGAGIGGYAYITKYVTNESGNWIYLDRPVSDVVATLSKYNISPAVVFEGDGNGARAISYIDNASGSIDRIDVVMPGVNYTNVSAYLQSNTAYGRGATVNIYPSPPGGHGFEPISELSSDRIMISKIITGSEGNTIPSFFDFRRVGLIKNPEASDGSPYLANTFNNSYTISVQNPGSFLANMNIVGETSKSKGYIFHKNANNTLEIVGDKNFIPGELIVSANNNLISSPLTNIVRTPDLRSLGTILDINNNIPISKENTSEIAKITLKIY